MSKRQACFSALTCHLPHQSPCPAWGVTLGQVLGLKRVKLKRWDRGCREAAGRQTLPGACSPGTKVTALLGKGQPGDQRGPRGRGPRSGLRSLGKRWWRAGHELPAWGGPPPGELSNGSRWKPKPNKRVKKREDTEIYSYLFLKGTGNKYISNDEELEVTDGGGRGGLCSPLKASSECSVLGPTT